MRIPLVGELPADVASTGGAVLLPEQAIPVGTVAGPIWVKCRCAPAAPTAGLAAFVIAELVRPPSILQRLDDNARCRAWPILDRTQLASGALAFSASAHLHGPLSWPLAFFGS